MSAPPARPATSPADGPSPTLVIGTLALSVVYALLTPLHLLALAGAARAVMASLAALSCLVCALMWRWARHPGPGTRRTGGLLLVMCAVPLVNSLAHIAVTGELEQTTVVMLSIVGVAAVHERARQVIGLVAASCTAWAVVVVTLHPGPVAQTGHYVIQLALACALGAGVFLIRAATTGRLIATRDELTSQLDESDRLRSEALGNSERIEAVFGHSPVGMALIDDHHQLVKANEALCALLGRPRDEVMGRSLADFRPLHGRPHSGGAPDQRSAAEATVRSEDQFLRPSGEVRWAWVSLRQVAGPQDGSYTLAHIEDVTDRKADEEKVRQSQEMMRAIVDIAHASQQDLDPRPPALMTLGSLARAMAVSILESTGDGRLSVSAASDSALVGTAVQLDEPSVTAHVWRTKETLFVSETHAHPLVNQRLLDLTGASSMMWQPVMSGETILAVLVLSWATSVSEVTEFELQAVSAIAAETAVALMAERMRRQLEIASVTDPLTGLLNRRGWDDALAELVSQSRRTGSAFTIALLDLDHFKGYNDTYGHLRGDDALVAFAAQARVAVRETDLVARWGGEEFAVALRDTRSTDAGPALERLHRAPPAGLTCSVGYAEVTPADDPDRVLTAVDSALFAAKQSGRNRIMEAPASVLP